MHISLETTASQAYVLISDLTFFALFIVSKLFQFALYLYLYLSLYRTSSSIRLSWHSWVARPFLLWSVLSSCNSVSARDSIKKSRFLMKMALLLPNRLWLHEVSPEVERLVPLSSALCSALWQWLNEACSSLGQMPSEIKFITVLCFLPFSCWS